MSDAQPSTPHDEPHEGPIKTPKQLALAVAFALLVPIFVIILLAVNVTTSTNPAAGSDVLGDEAVARRIQRVSHAELKVVADPATAKTGEEVYTAQCSACHAAGTLGSPKFGDAAAWAPRIKTGYPALLNSALKGKNAMSAQGGGAHSDYEIARAVVYMANKGGAKFAEPAVPVAAGASAAKP